jgi:hypothetical protein
MGVVIEICIKYPGGPTRMTGADVRTVSTVCVASSTRVIAVTYI